MDRLNQLKADMLAAEAKIETAADADELAVLWELHTHAAFKYFQALRCYGAVRAYDGLTLDVVPEYTGQHAEQLIDAIINK